MTKRQPEDRRKAGEREQNEARGQALVNPTAATQIWTPIPGCHLPGIKTNPCLGLGPPEGHWGEDSCTLI